MVTRKKIARYCAFLEAEDDSRLCPLNYVSSSVQKARISINGASLAFAHQTVNLFAAEMRIELLSLK